MERKTWYEILKRILDSNDFQIKIKRDGYFRSPREFRNFREYTSKVWNTVSTNTAQFLSKDFWYQQPSVLTEKGYYLIRTGEGSFVIFDEKFFPSPYLDLKIENPKFVDTLEPDGYEHLKQAFRENIIENTALEQLRFNGVYEKIINDISGDKQQYYVGIRGNTTRTFNVYFKKKNENEPILIYQYKGQAELDYSLWTKDSVFLFEAKKINNNLYNQSLRIGWHKFAYAAADSEIITI